MSSIEGKMSEHKRHIGASSSSHQLWQRSSRDTEKSEHGKDKRTIDDKSVLKNNKIIRYLR